MEQACCLRASDAFADLAGYWWAKGTQVSRKKSLLHCRVFDSWRPRNSREVASWLRS